MTNPDFRNASLEQHIRITANYLPTGRVWASKFDLGRNLGKLVSALSSEFFRLFADVEKLALRELDTSKTRDLLIDWEDSVGIPDRCFGVPNTVEERRQRVQQKLDDFNNPITKLDIENLLASFGEQIQIVHGDPDDDGNAARFGFTTPVVDADERRRLLHTVGIRSAGASTTFALPFPIPFTSTGNTLVECLTRRLLPAHFDVVVFFGENLSLPFVQSTPTILGTASQSVASVGIGAASGTALEEITGAASEAIGGVSLGAASGTLVNAGPNVALLDAWTNESSAITAPGSKAVSPGSNRLLLARTSSRAGTQIPVTALSWGGQPMTLVEQVTTVDGPDMHTALWLLDEADIAAGSGDAFAITPNSGATQFRLQAASYENVDQVDPILDSFINDSVGGANVVSQSMVTDDGGIALAFVAANRGTSDVGATEDVAYSNMTETIEENATQSYNSIGQAVTNGTNFTPSVTLTHETAGHLIGATLRKA